MGLDSYTAVWPASKDLFALSSYVSLFGPSSGKTARPFASNSLQRIMHSLGQWRFNFWSSSSCLIHFMDLEWLNTRIFSNAACILCQLQVFTPMFLKTKGDIRRSDDCKQLLFLLVVAHNCSLYRNWKVLLPWLPVLMFPNNIPLVH